MFSKQWKRLKIENKSTKLKGKKIVNKQGKIGVFDSGIGGATVLKEILKILPNEEYIYYSDSKNNPYGDKTDKEIMEICDNIVKYLLEKDCKIIVIACNTASAKAVDSLRKKYNKIIFVAIEPAYKMVHDYAYEKATLVMATKGTIESEKFQLLYKKYNNNNTYLLPCIGLADIIEQGNNEKILDYLQETISHYKGKVENVVLGCTHYPLIKGEISQSLGNVTFFDGAKRLANHLKDILIEEKLENTGNGKVHFIDSQGSKSKEERFFKILKK